MIEDLPEGFNQKDIAAVKRILAHIMVMSEDIKKQKKKFEENLLVGAMAVPFISEEIAEIISAQDRALEVLTQRYSFYDSLLNEMTDNKAVRPLGNEAASRLAAYQSFLQQKG